MFVLAVIFFLDKDSLSHPCFPPYDWWPLHKITHTHNLWIQHIHVQNAATLSVWRAVSQIRKHSFGGWLKFPESEGLKHWSWAPGENHLPPLVYDGGYFGDVCGPICYSWSGGAGGEHQPNPQSTWATLFLSKNPESNSSHMSVITEESDETLMSLSVFPSLSLCVSFCLFLSFHWLIVVPRNPQD